MRNQSGLLSELLSKATRAALVGTLLLTAACVTTTNAPEQNADLKKAEQTHISAGEGYLRRGDKDSARRHFSKALTYDANSAGANNGMALVYQLEQEWSLAEEHFRRALRADPKFSQARNNYGLFLYSQKRYPEAIEQLRIAAEDVEYPNRHASLANMGITQLKMGETDEAVRSLKQAVSIHYRLPAAHIELAEIYYTRKEYALSRFHYGQYVKMVPRQSSRSLWLGIRLERVFGDKDKEASYSLALKNLYPYSEEYLQFKQSLKK